ncbi:MAG TPA: MmcQ/YjbR family DNA-binding protein [Candidatus Limnocylindrales bacterium]|jgi:hypothetical protein
MPTFDDVRAICLGLPEVEEVLTWGTDITFRVKGKIFAIGGEGAAAVSIKATPEVQADLIALDPTTFASSAYTGRFGWTTVQLAGIAEPHLRELLDAAWRRTAPARIRNGVTP